MPFEPALGLLCTTPVLVVSVAKSKSFEPMLYLYRGVDSEYGSLLLHDQLIVEGDAT